MAEWIRNSRLMALLLKYFARAHIWVYRRTDGRLGAKLLWFPAALLTTTGRRSNEPRTTATLYLRDGARVIVPASFGGRHEHPLWYAPASGWGHLPLVGACPHNLKENPEVRVQIRAQHLDLVARDATAVERERYWPPLTRMYPPYRKYRQATDRVIPLVVCEPR